METKRLEIAVDKDDVLVDFVEGLNEFHNGKYGTKLCYDDYFSYDFSKVWGCSREEASSRIEEFYLTDLFYELKPVPGAKAGIKSLSEFSNISIVTSRAETLAEPTHASLAYHFSEIDFTSRVHFANTHHPELLRRTKSEICLGLGVSLIIDDSLGHVYDASAAGIRSILFRRPWNIEASDNELFEKGITPVKSWDEILSILN